MFDNIALVSMTVGHGEYEDRRGGGVTLHCVPSFVEKIPELGANYVVVAVCEESADILMGRSASPVASVSYVLFKLKITQVSTEYRPLKQRIAYKSAYNQHEIGYTALNLVLMFFFLDVQINKCLWRLSVDFFNCAQLV